MKLSKILAVSLVLAIGCGGSKNQPATPAPSPAPHEAMAGMCPMDVPNTTVAATDTSDGVAVMFTTSGDATQLRERVHKMAAMHEHMQESAAAGSGDTGMKMVPSTVRVDDGEGGARIVLVPKNAADLPALRTHVHEHAEHMASSGHCPMMGEHAGHGG